jgi:hypothetical protein
MLFLAAAGPAARAAEPAPSPYFRIQVVDDRTGRGVPLVELQTTNNVPYFTDSNGLVAYLEPGLMGQTVYFHVKSHGYEYPKDGFGYSGVALKPVAGGRATVRIKRINIAERLYRLTGGGIYRDTVLLGEKPPIAEPVLNGLVFGCDSVFTIEYRGRLCWFWGDTNRPAYPLGNFYMTGARSSLPADGGLDPDVGVNFEYWTGEDGFARAMARLSKVGPTWCDAFVTLNDESGRERLYGAYANVNPAMQTLERGLCRFDDDKQVFEKLLAWDLKAPNTPGGHPFRLRAGGTEYIYFTQSLPFRRVRANAGDFSRAEACQAFTCLAQGSRVEDARIDRDSQGRPRYSWKTDTPPLAPADEKKLIDAGQLKADEALIHLRDADSGKPLLAHASSLYWNGYRKRWVLIVCEIMGTSLLGETWFAEADTPLGPWVYARKIITHDKYSFYNPRQHPLFAKNGGRFIYLEGTYTHTFSGNTVQTPRYDYNQIMYRLDLADPRLVLPVPVYGVAGPGPGLATLERLPAPVRPHAIAFFAPDRPAPGLVAVCRSDRGGRAGLATRPADGPTAADEVVFYALPPGPQAPPATTLPLWEYTRDDGTRTWSVQESLPGHRRAPSPLCRVWKSPTRLTYPLDEP